MSFSVGDAPGNTKNFKFEKNDYRYDNFRKTCYGSLFKELKKKELFIYYLFLGFISFLWRR